MKLIKFVKGLFQKKRERDIMSWWKSSDLPAIEDLKTLPDSRIFIPTGLLEFQMLPIPKIVTVHSEDLKVAEGLYSELLLPMISNGIIRVNQTTRLHFLKMDDFIELPEGIMGILSLEGDDVPTEDRQFFPDRLYEDLFLGMEIVSFRGILTHGKNSLYGLGVSRSIGFYNPDETITLRADKVRLKIRFSEKVLIKTEAPSE